MLILLRLLIVLAAAHASDSKALCDKLLKEALIAHLKLYALTFGGDFIPTDVRGLEGAITESSGDPGLAARFREKVAKLRASKDPYLMPVARFFEHPDDTDIDICIAGSTCEFYFQGRPLTRDTPSAAFFDLKMRNLFLPGRPDRQETGMRPGVHAIVVHSPNARNFDRWFGGLVHEMLHAADRDFRRRWYAANLSLPAAKRDVVFKTFVTINENGPDFNWNVWLAYTETRAYHAMLHENPHAFELSFIREGIHAYYDRILELPEVQRYLSIHNVSWHDPLAFEENLTRQMQRTVR
jgi:hypothetical protein